MAKLVEILARELVEWPMACGGEHRTQAMAQDSDGGLVRLDHLKETHQTQFDGEDWSRECWTGYAYYVELSEDHATAIVTRAEWQAAVDAMQCAVVPGRRYKVITGPAEWNENINLIGTQVVVLFTFKNVLGQNLAVIERNGGECSCLILECLEPLPSQDQIDALERERIQDEIQRICTDGENSGVPFFKALYDAGYRKQEPK